jgi:hypothetical protein
MRTKPYIKSLNPSKIQNASQNGKQSSNAITKCNNIASHNPVHLFIYKESQSDKSIIKHTYVITWQCIILLWFIIVIVLLTVNTHNFGL